MAEALQVGDQVGGQDRPRRPGARLPAPGLHAPALRPARPRAAHRPARPRRVRRRRAPVRAGEGLALGPRPRRREDRDQDAPRRQGPAPLRGRGRLYADAAAELLQFAELAQVPVLTTLKAKGAFPENHPLSVGVRGSHAEHFLRKCRRAVLDRLEPVPEPVQPLRPGRRQEDHRAVHGGHARHQPELRDAARRHRRRQAHPARARRRAHARGARKRPEVLEEIREAKQAFLGEVPAVARVGRDADQSLPRPRRPHEGARSQELVRDRGLRQHARSDEHGVRGADPARATSAGATSPRSASAWPARWRPSSRIPTGSACTSPATPASAT